MATYGKVKAFNLRVDDWEVYEEQLRFYMVANNITNATGAALSHIVNGGEERPIAYISRTLSAAEKCYSQLEKEALAIIVIVKKFHCYLIGRHFAIESDHQPLKTIFGETSKIPNMASSRIVCWAIILSACQYSI